MTPRVLIVTTEMLPGLGYPTAGGGMRAYSIGEGLKSHGLHVDYSLRDSLLKEKPLPNELSALLHNTDNIDDVINNYKPDVVIFEQWHPLLYCKSNNFPLAVDVPGPLLLEQAYKDPKELNNLAGTKIKALSKADVFCCSNSKQKGYWTAWMLLSGVPVTDFNLLEVPICASPELPPLPAIPKDKNDLRFFHTGIFWPWQNFIPALEILSNIMENENAGKLEIYGGKHPYHPSDENTKSPFPDSILNNNRVTIHDLVKPEELFDAYKAGGVALEVMSRNPERDLSSTIRTIGFLWSGLPVVISSYSYLTDMINEYKAGWVADSESPEEIEKVFKEIFKHPEQVSEKAKGAQNLIKEKFTWDISTKELAEFCKSPRRRNRNPVFMEDAVKRIEGASRLDFEFNEFIQRFSEAQNQLLETEQRWAVEHDRWQEPRIELDNIRNKPLFKFYKKIKEIIKK